MIFQKNGSAGRKNRNVQKNLDPKKPRPLKTWSQKKLEIQKPKPRKTLTMNTF